MTSVRFYIKCVDKMGVATTYRFHREADLLDFVAQTHTLGLAIVDTHMAFYDVALLAPVFGVEIHDIDHLDINVAKDGSQYIGSREDLSVADNDTAKCLPNFLADTTKSDKSKAKKAKKAKKSKTKEKKSKPKNKDKAKKK